MSTLNKDSAIAVRSPGCEGPRTLEHKRVHFLVVRFRRVRRPGGQQRAIGIAIAPKIGVQSSLVARERDALVSHEERAGHPGCVKQCHEIRQDDGVCPFHVDGQTQGVGGEAVRPGLNLRGHVPGILTQHQPGTFGWVAFRRQILHTPARAKTPLRDSSRLQRARQRHAHARCPA